ncbi:hypothetical protein BGZ76_011612 [Entomortierella beljakovae]|nr:hypothetical protein BGZ76_011612 [Entomortierella beljakovae]
MTSQLLSSKNSSHISNKGKGRQDLDPNTIQWKLANTNPCPNCCILIHRDDGCNKVDCMLCGYRFCWVCRESWGSACGFFSCGRQPAIIEPSFVEPAANTMDEITGKHSIALQESISEEEQVQSLAVSQSSPLESTQAQIDLSIQQDLQARRLENFPAVFPDKPEIGVPNVFVIHTKRSRS